MADVAGFLMSVSMYLVVPIVVEFIQIPPSAGFGFGASVVVSGFVLTPLSLGTFLASRLLVPYERRFGVRSMIPLGALVFAAASTYFALDHGSLWQAFVTMGIAGLGIGFTFAAMPGLHHPGRPHRRDGQRHRLLPGAPQHRPVGGERLRRRRAARPTPPPAPRLPDLDGFRVALLISAGLGLADRRAQLRPARVGPARRPPPPAPAAPDAVEVRMEEEALLEATGAMLVDELDLDAGERGRDRRPSRPAAGRRPPRRRSRDAAATRAALLARRPGPVRPQGLRADHHPGDRRGRRRRPGTHRPLLRLQGRPLPGRRGRRAARRRRAEPDDRRPTRPSTTWPRWSRWCCAGPPDGARGRSSRPWCATTPPTEIRAGGHGPPGAPHGRADGRRATGRPGSTGPTLRAQVAVAAVARRGPRALARVVRRAGARRPRPTSAGLVTDALAATPAADRPALRRTDASGPRSRAPVRRVRTGTQVLLHGPGDAPGDDLLGRRAGGQRALERVGHEQRLDQRAGHGATAW